jgi:SdpC family antimicrobial peptide
MKQMLKAVIATSLISALAVFGLPSRVYATGGIPLPPQPAQTVFTGEQIFRGIFLGDTPVSQLFPEIWDSNIVADTFDTAEKILAWANFKKSLVDQITSTDETFMNSFGLEMLSGDQLRVQAALADASQRMATAMQTLGYVDQNGYPQPDCDIFVFGAIAIILAVGLAGIGFSIVYYYYYHAVTVYQFRRANGPEELTQADSALYEESLIGSITDKLASSQ